MIFGLALACFWWSLGLSAVLDDPTPSTEAQPPVKGVEDVDPGPTRIGMRARRSYRPDDSGRPTVCLVHGINSTSGCFVHLIPVLENAGYGIVLYDYPYNEDLDAMAPAFARDWADFREEHDDEAPWAILTHSMGGLLARWYVEGPLYGDDVAALILIGPPNQGSALARGHGILRWLESIGAIGGSGQQAEPVLAEGSGEAAIDLTPGSRFLDALNARARPPEVPYYILAGDVGFFRPRGRHRIEAAFETFRSRARLLGGFAMAALGDLGGVLDVLTDGTGDGAIALASARLDGADEIVVLPVNHVELIRGPLFFPEPGPVACAPDVLRWLRSTFPVPPDPGDDAPPRCVETDSAGPSSGALRAPSIVAETPSTGWVRRRVRLGVTGRTTVCPPPRPGAILAPTSSPPRTPTPRGRLGRGHWDRSGPPLPLQTSNPRTTGWRSPNRRSEAVMSARTTPGPRDRAGETTGRLRARFLPHRRAGDESGA